MAFILYQLVFFSRLIYYLMFGFLVSANDLENNLVKPVNFSTDYQNLCKSEMLKSCHIPEERRSIACRILLPGCSDYFDCFTKKQFGCPKGSYINLTTWACGNTEITCFNPSQNYTYNECNNLNFNCTNWNQINSHPTLSCPIIEENCNSYYNCSNYLHYFCGTLMFSNFTKTCIDKSVVCETAVDNQLANNLQDPNIHPIENLKLTTAEQTNFLKSNKISNSKLDYHSIPYDFDDELTPADDLTTESNRVPLVRIQTTQTDVVSGSKAEFTCTIKIYKTDKFSWFINKIRIKPSKRVMIKNNRWNQSTLIIDPIMETESGYLACYSVYDNAFHDFDTVHINVIKLFRLLIFPLHRKVSINTNLTVLCKVTNVNKQNENSLKNYKLVWYLNGTILQTVTPQEINEKEFFVNQSMDITCSLESVGIRIDPGDTCRILYIHMQANKKMCLEEKAKEILWGPMNPLSTDIQPCPEGYTGHLSRICFANSTWGEVDSNECLMNRMLDMENKITQFELQITPVNSTELLEFLNDLPHTFQNCETGLDVMTGVDILYKVANLLHGTEILNVDNEEETSKIMKSLGILLSYDVWAESQQQNYIGSLKLLQTINMYSNKPRNKAWNRSSYLQPNEYLTFERRQLTAGDQTFPDWSMYTPNMSHPGNIIILRQNSTTGRFASCSFVEKLAGVLPNAENDTFINSGMLSMDVLSMGATNSDDLANLHSSVLVEITLKHLKPKEINSYNSSCVFWKFTDLLSGYWSDEGCTLKISNETHTTCTCNHLTNFAILFSPYRATGVHEKILSMISLVGCIVSIVSLVLTIIFYAIRWRIVKSKQAAILINLCASLIIANIIFLVGVNQTSNKNGCTAVAILLHYFFLVSFFIMLVIAIHLIFNVFLVFHSLTKRNITMMIVLAWALPLIIVFITMGATRLLGYGDSKNCWLTYEHGVLWAFVAPALAIILFNSIAATATVIRLCNSNVTNALKKDNKAKILSSARNILVLNPILGLTWIFGVLSVNEELIVFQYIFAIVNSLQGFFIFILHSVCHKKNFNDKSKVSSTSTNQQKLNEKLPPSQQPRLHLARQSQEWMQPRGSIIKNLTKPEQEMCSENYVEYSFSSGFNNKTFSMSDQSNIGNFKNQLPTYSHISSDSFRASSTIENENDNQIMGKF